MNEENTNITENNENDWQPPPLPEQILKEEVEPPRMSEVATLGNIFIEPGNTFEDMRRKPRFIIAGLIICLLTTVFMITFQMRMGEERYKTFFTEQVERNPQASSMSPEQKETQINVSMTITKVIIYALPFIVIITFLLGGLLYWLGVKALGGAMTYLQGVSVWIYSSFPPAIVSLVANFIVLFFKSPDEIDIAASQRGLIQSNPSMFINGKEMPVVATLLSSFDFFLIWGLILAAIGLHKTGKISKGSAWAIVLIIALIGITWRVLSALMSGNPS